MALSQHQIVATGIDLLDRTGIGGLTLRKLAAELGVSAPTLYWHVDDKRHLLDLMVEELYGRADVRPSPASGEPWWEWLAANARAQRRALLSVRDAALVVAGNRPTARSLPFIERSLESLLAAGVDGAAGIHLLRSLNDYVIGSAIEYQSMQARRPSPERDAEMVATVQSSPDYPVLQATLSSASDDLEMIFESGLRWFIGGARAELGHRPATSSVTNS